MSRRSRLRASLRPRRAARPDVIRQGGLVIDMGAHLVSRDGEQLRLTPKEFDLLAALASNGGRVMTHHKLLQRVWGPAHVDDVPYLRVFIGQLRQKLEPDPAKPALILTEPGVGYRWAQPEESLP